MLLSYTPWKHQKTFRFSDVFRGYRKVKPGCNGLNDVKEFSIRFGSPRLGHTKKLTVYNIRLFIQRYAKVWFFTKGSWTSFSTAFCVWFFLRKTFVLLYSCNWPNLIVWLPLLLEILGNMCIAVTCCSVYDFINFENNLSFLIKLFWYINKKVGTKM